MKIYFSGSIRGGRDHRELYSKVIDELKKYGQVLTEHIGDEKPSEKMSDQEIHDQDMNWLRESDIVIADVTTASLGVGYEIGRALHLNKPVHCFYNKEKESQVSAMILGSNELSCRAYQNAEDIFEELRQIFT